MATGFDALVDFLLAEIALCGVHGTFLPISSSLPSPPPIVCVWVLRQRAELFRLA